MRQYSWHAFCLYRVKGSGELNKKVVLASHGDLANGMLSALEMIIGHTDDIYSFGLSQYASPEVISQEVEKIESDLLIIVCDLKGGSVYNRLIELSVKEKVLVISGMHLGMVLELVLTNFDENYRLQVESIVEASKNGVELFNLQKALSEFEKEADRLW